MILLVTGTAGFIGFHLAKRLLDSGYAVIGLDNLNDYYCVDIKRRRHDLLGQYDTFTPAEIDMCDFSSLDMVFKKHSPQVVCNLAAQAGVRYSLINPFAYQKSNLEGFLNMIELSKRYAVKRFVYASSSSVYAGVKEVPFYEDQRLDSPISLYASTKMSNELTAHVYSHLFGLQTVGLRFFTVYGPWGRPDMAMWIFTENILAGKKIKVFNHGKMKRDFTFIDDIVSGTEAALFNAGLPAYSVFNLGNNKCEELLDVIGILEKELGKKADMEMLPMQPGDVEATWADITQAQDKLRFTPSTTVAEGVPRFLEWYLANGDLAEAVRLLRDD